MITDRYYFQQHRMVWMTSGFVCGSLFILLPHDYLGAVLLAAWGVSACSLYCGKREFLLLLLFCLLGVGNAQMAAQSLDYQAFSEGQAVQVVGTVQESRRGQSYLWLRAEQVEGQPLRNAVRFYVGLPDSNDGEGAEAVWYPAGSRVQLVGRLQMPQEQRNPGGFDERAWLRGKQVAWKLQAKELLVVREPQGIWRCSWQVQQFLFQTAEQYLPAKEAGFAMALLLGEKQGLDSEFYRLTQRMGIAHIFAVSGLHVGFVGTMLLFVFRALRWERSWISFLFLLAGLVGYCILTGLPPSALRATAMILLAALAMRLLRPIQPVDFLAAAALLLLWENPYLLFTAGFQLSFGVTLSLLCLTGPLQANLSWIQWRWLRSGLVVALASYLGSLPFSAWHFYCVSIWAPLYNLLLVPVVSILVPCLLLTFLAVFLVPAGGIILFAPVGWLLQILLQGTYLLSDMTGRAQIYIGRPPWLACMLYLLLLLLLWRQLQKRTDEERNAWLGRWSGIAVLLLGSVWLCWPHPPAEDELLYLDAGQGSCAILRTTAGETVLFDGGAQIGELRSCLAWYGVNEVQAMVISHGDSDHLAGLAQVLEAMPVYALCAEESQLQRDTMEPLLSLAAQQGTTVKGIAACETVHLKHGAVRLQVYTDAMQDNNSRELTAVLQTPWAVVAFPGDLGLYGVWEFVQDIPELTVWTVPHHGSRYSASAELYQLLRQKGVQQVIISAGKQNRYGHPHQEVLQFLTQQQIPWQRTDEQGAILLTKEALSAP